MPPSAKPASPDLVLVSRLVGEDHYRSARHTVRPIICVDPFDYWVGVNEVWDTDATIVNVEHDVQCSDALVDELLDCPHPVCSWAYRIHHRCEGFWAHDVSLVGWHPPIEPLSQYSARGRRWVVPGDEWADFSAIGFCKIKASARCAPLRHDSWLGVEISVNRAIDQRWHMHWGPDLAGVEHYHR